MAIKIFGTAQTTLTGDEDSLFSYDESGNQIFAESIVMAGPTYSWYRPVAADPDENSYVCPQAGIYWDASNKRSVAKYDSAGNMSWDAYFTQGTHYGIAITPSRNILVAINRSLMDLPGTVWASVYFVDGAAHTLTWYVDTGARIYAAATDASGNCYAGGYVVLGKSVWSWEEDGTPRWEATCAEACLGLAVDPTGTYVYALTTDYIRKFLCADGSEITSGNYPIDLSTYGTSSAINGICCDYAGHVYVALYDLTYIHMALVAFSETGAHLWTTAMASNWYSEGLAVSPHGHIYIMGTEDPSGLGTMFIYDSTTGAEITDGLWPVTDGVDYGRGVAVAPGTVGAFATDWLAYMAAIYVGRVDFE